MGGGAPQRGAFATLTAADLAVFRGALEASSSSSSAALAPAGTAVLTDAKSLDAANEDWWDGRCKLNPG